MHNYFIKTPWLLKKIFWHHHWSFSKKEYRVFLTFDDGPHPTITPWVLDELKKYNAKATFFCVGNNVVKYPEVYARILSEGHKVGNHTHNHLNGWKVGADAYLNDVAEAAKHIQSNLFRPPYGRITSKQAKGLQKVMRTNVSIIMWDVLSADFDADFTPEQCFLHIAKHTSAGSVIVFHDSEKAANSLFYALPKTLKFLADKNYQFHAIET